jgi:hypothetical protein
MGSENGGANQVFSPGFDVSGFRHMTTIAVVKDVGGTMPVMNIVIEHSMDGETWLPLATFAPISASTSQPEVSIDFARFVRARYTYTGTEPWFTFSLMAIARG